MSEESRETIIQRFETTLVQMRECSRYTPEDVDELESAAWDALSLLKAQETSTALWIHCGGKSHIWYCSNCGEKVNYNNARRTYTKGMKPIEEVNRFCRGCGAIMLSAEQRKVVKRSADASDQTKMV